MGAGDVLIIHSVSGRNNVPVEMALGAKKRGATVIGITSLAYSGSVTSRHKAAKRLFECCDIVLVNKGVPGTRQSLTRGFPSPAAHLHRVRRHPFKRRHRGRHLANGGKSMYPPVFMSANLDGGEAYNRKIFETYQDQIFYE